MQNVQSVVGVSNVHIPDAWLGNDAALALKAAPLLLLAVMLRGVVLWLLNGVLLVHVGRAVRVMQAGGTRGAKVGSLGRVRAVSGERPQRPG